jgi:hypothetical protein
MEREKRPSSLFRQVSRQGYQTSNLYVLRIISLISLIFRLVLSRLGRMPEAYLFEMRIGMHVIDKRSCQISTQR